MKALPVHTRTVGPPTQPLAPAAFDLPLKTPQGARIAGDAVVGVVTHELPSERRMLLRERPVPLIPTPLPDPVHSTLLSRRIDRWIPV